MSWWPPASASRSSEPPKAGLPFELGPELLLLLRPPPLGLPLLLGVLMDACPDDVALLLLLLLLLLSSLHMPGLR